MWVFVSVLKMQRVACLGKGGRRPLYGGRFLCSVTKINDGSFELEVHIILVVHRSPPAQAYWETKAFLL